jgi:hypothetical protein
VILLSEIIKEIGLHDKPITNHTAYNAGMKNTRKLQGHLRQEFQIFSCCFQDNKGL